MKTVAVFIKFGTVGTIEPNCIVWSIPPNIVAYIAIDADNVIMIPIIFSYIAIIRSISHHSIRNLFKLFQECFLNIHKYSKLIL